MNFKKKFTLPLIWYSFLSIPLSLFIFSSEVNPSSAVKKQSQATALKTAVAKIPDTKTKKSAAEIKDAVAAKKHAHTQESPKEIAGEITGKKTQAAAKASHDKEAALTKTTQETAQAHKTAAEKETATHKAKEESASAKKSKSESEEESGTEEKAEGEEQEEAASKEKAEGESEEVAASEKSESESTEAAAEEAERTTETGIPEIDINLAEAKEIEILPLEAPEGVKLEKVTFDLPLIGTVVLDPTKDEKTQEDILKGTLADETRKLNLGPLTIDKGEIIMRPGDKITVSGRTTLFGKPATLTLKDLTRTAKLETEAAEGASKWQIGRMHLELKFIEKPTVSILPDQKIILNKCNLLLERGKPVTVSANIKLFGQPVKLIFDITKEILGVSFVMTRPLPLGSLVKSLKPNRFGSVLFKNINFRTTMKVSQKELSETAELPKTTFSGQVDFSSIFPGTPTAQVVPGYAAAVEAAEEATGTKVDAEADAKSEAEKKALEDKAATAKKAETPEVVMGTYNISTATGTEETLSPEGPVSPLSSKALDAIKKRFGGLSSKLVVPGETTNDATVTEEKSDVPPLSDDALDKAAITQEQSKKVTAESTEKESGEVAQTAGAQEQAETAQAQETEAPAAGAAATPATTTPTDDATTQLDTPVNNLEFSARYSKEEGINFEALVTNLQLPVLGQVKNAKFVFDYGMKKNNIPKLMLSGEGSVDVPKIGFLNYELKAGYSKNGLLLKAALKKEINFENQVIIRNGNLTVKPKKKIFIIGGDTRIHNFDLIAAIEVKPNPEDKSKTTVNFNAEVQKETFKPFENTGIATIKDFVVRNLKAKVRLGAGETKEAELTISGVSNILRVEGEVLVRFLKNNQGQSGVLLSAILPENWKLTDSISQLRGTPLDKITFKKAQFIASSFDTFTDPDSNIEYKKGLSLSALCPLTGALTPVSTLLGGKLDTVDVYGTISPNPEDLLLGAKLTKEGEDQTLALKTKTVTSGPLALEITGKPSIAILATIYVNPSEKEKPLTFIGRIQIDPLEANFAATMLGTWQRPFNINGFTLSNLASQLGINYAQFAATGLPSKLGLAGQMALGDRQLAMAAQFDSTFKDMALFGSLNELTLVDLVKWFAIPAGAKIPVDKVPKAALKDIEVKFAPKDVKIGEVKIPQGITVKGELQILKERAILDCNVSSSGIKALGYTTPILYGPLKITASHPQDSPTGGPIVSLQLTPAVQEFLVSGKLDLEKIFLVDSYLKINPSGIELNFDTDIANGMFNAHVEGKSSGPIQNPDFELIIDMKQKFMAYVLAKINEELTKAQKQLKEKIERAQREVEKVNRAIETSDRDINAAKAKVEGVKRTVDVLNTRIEEANRAIDSARRQVTTAQDKLNELNRAREESDRELNKAIAELDRAKNKAAGDIKRAQADFNNRIGPARSNVDNLRKTYENTGCESVKSFASFWKFKWLTDCGKKYAAKSAYEIANAGLVSLESSASFSLRIAEQSANAMISVAQSSVDKIARGAARAGIIAAQRTAQQALNIYKQALDKVVRAVAIGSLEAARKTAQSTLSAAQNFLEGMRQISRGALEAARNTGVGFLEGMKQSGVAVLEGGKYVAKGLLGTVEIRRARFEGSLKKITAGKLPDMTFLLAIVNKERVINFSFDFTKPAESAISLARAVTDLILGGSAKFPEPAPVNIPERPKELETPPIEIPPAPTIEPVDLKIAAATEETVADTTPIVPQSTPVQEQPILGLPKVTAAEIKANANCADLSIGCVKQVTFSIDNQTDLDIRPVIVLEAPINKTIDIATLVEIYVLPYALKDSGKNSYAINIVPKNSLSPDITSVSGGAVKPTIFPILYPNSRLTLEPIPGYKIFGDPEIQDNVSYTVTAKGKQIYLNPAQPKIVPATITVTNHTAYSAVVTIGPKTTTLQPNETKAIEFNRDNPQITVAELNNRWHVLDAVSAEAGKSYDITETETMVGLVPQTTYNIIKKN